MRRYLGRFGITDNMQLMQMGYLSGGQKSRIAFALIVYQVCAPAECSLKHMVSVLLTGMHVCAYLCVLVSR